MNVQTLRPLNRRTFLRATGIGMALLFMETMIPARAHAADATAPEPLMLTRGKQVTSKHFDQENDVDEASMAFRKDTQYKVEDGLLHIIPSIIAFAGTDKIDKSDSKSMARAGLIEVPHEYICQFRWKYHRSENPNYATSGSTIFDLGHRCIRTTFTRRGTTLKLDNRLLGKDGPEPSKLLLDQPGLKLEPEKWYDITIEVKGTEVILQIDGHTLYGKDELIANERENTFNVDSDGDGYVLDHIEIWEAGDYHPDWEAQRKKIATN
jgi:hypothetical protein